MNTTIPLYHHPYSGYRYEESSRFYSPSYTPPEEVFDDEDQIPTLDEFRAIVDDYLHKLSPKKRDKALVDQHRYCLIQQVLKDPRNTAISTAQFRFWVKKMFQLQPGTTDLVCHDNKPVAMKEQIYDILVKAHREAHHGGRDKTSALVRRRFSWIPKELVARFVRHCPFCITRRNSGHSPTTPSNTINKNSSRYLRHAYSFDSNSNMPTMICTPSSIKEEADLSSGPPSSSDSGYEVTSNYASLSATSSPKRSSFFPMYEREDFLNYASTTQFGLQPFSQRIQTLAQPSPSLTAVAAAAQAAAAAALMRSPPTPHQTTDPTTVVDLLSHQQDRYPSNHSYVSFHQPLNLTENGFQTGGL
ncbi:hypothetical protein EDC96DRAFT_481503 [Choanephora cucurbitarum]|nr:hypothetical protein EDC96DRAFT_481503 [Choanephora cucurbitarum]